jgi:hypothetical protein
MAGKAGRSGRPPGAQSWHHNATARCGHRLNVLIELWLAPAPERRFTVPPKIKRALAERAIRETLDNEIESPEVVAVDVDDVLAWSRRQAPDGPSLRRKVRGPDAYDQYVARISNAWRSPQGDMNPCPGDDSAVDLIVSLDSANPNVCWTETDGTIVASAVTTFPN